MTAKHIAIIVIYGLVCFALSLVIVQCSGREAEKAVQEARADASSAREALAAAQAENATLREYSRRADDAVMRAIEAIREASGKHDERVQDIDSVDDSWLVCELPDGVRDAFAEYTAR